MAIPLLKPISDPPLPTDSEEVFDAKAGTSLTDQQYMVNVDLNTKVIPAINAATAQIDADKNAAATSAGAASDSATAANGFKNAAAQQVVLAADQVALANTAKGEAQAAALAAGAAAGLPPQRVPFSVLQVDGAGAVGWGYGLPDRAAAQAGYSLILGPGKVPTWGFAGDQIGDILYTSRAPGATYLPASGGIYLQSSYPQLFALIGLIGGQRATVFTAKSATPPFITMEFGENGVVLGVSGTAGTTGNVYRSTDYGLTFSLVATAITANAILQLLHLGGSKWLAGGNGTNPVLISSDDGSTWTPVTVAASFTFVSAATDKAGTVLVRMINSAIYRSINYGASFTALSFSAGSVFCYAGAGRWIANYSGNYNYMLVSDDAFSTYSVVSIGGTMVTANATGITADPTSGTVVAFVGSGNAASVNLAISYDRGVSFGAMPSGSATAPKAVVFAGGDTWLILGYSNSTTWEIRKSINGAKTFTTGPSVPTANGPVMLHAEPLKGYVIANGQTVGAASYAVSAPVLGYDGATQFKLPTLTKHEGASPYVKAI